MTDSKRTEHKSRGPTKFVVETDECGNPIEITVDVHMGGDLWLFIKLDPDGARRMVQGLEKFIGRDVKIQEPIPDHYCVGDPPSGRCVHGKLGNEVCLKCADD